jgi:hypothetical protein
MIVAVQGTSSFDDYQVFLRAMGVALSSLTSEDPEFLIYSAGPASVNSMVSEFANISERGMKSRKKKIKFYKVAPSWISENLESFNYFAFLSKPSEPLSRLAEEAQLKNIDVGIYRY